MALRDRIVVKLGLDPDQFNRQLKTTERRLKNTARGLESWGRKASMVSLPIAAAGGAAIKVATDYEASLTKIKTLVGINAKQVDDWGKQILEKSGDLGRGPNELAEALFFVTSAGLRSAAALDVVEMSAKASVVGLGNTAIVAKLVVSAMQAYSKSNLTAKDSVDALMATVRFGNIESEELAGSMGRVMGIAAEMGVSIQEAGAFVATYTRVGVDANIATTALRATLSMLLGPGDQARQILQRLGLTVEEMHARIRDDGLAKTLVNIANATDINAIALDELIPNIRALAGVLAVAKSQGEVYLDIAGKMARGEVSTQEEFERTRKTAKFMFSSLVAEIEVFATKVGSLFLPRVVAIVTGLIEWAKQLSKTSDETKEWIVAVGAGLAVMGPFALALGAVIHVITPVVIGLKAMTLGLLSFTGATALATKAVVILRASMIGTAAATAAAWAKPVAVILAIVGAAVIVRSAFSELLMQSNSQTEAMRKDWGTVGRVFSWLSIKLQQLGIDAVIASLHFGKIGIAIAGLVRGRKWADHQIKNIDLVIAGLEETRLGLMKTHEEFYKFQAMWKDARATAQTGSLIDLTLNYGDGAPERDLMARVEELQEQADQLVASFGSDLGLAAASDGGKKALESLMKEFQSITTATEDAFAFSDLDKEILQLERIGERVGDAFDSLSKTPEGLIKLAAVFKKLPLENFLNTDDLASSRAELINFFQNYLSLQFQATDAANEYADAISRADNASSGIRSMFEGSKKSLEDFLAVTEVEKFEKSMRRARSEFSGYVKELNKTEEGRQKIEDLKVSLGRAGISASQLGEEIFAAMSKANPAIVTATSMVRQLQRDIEDAAAKTPEAILDLKVSRGESDFRDALAGLQGGGHTETLEALRKSIGAVTTETEDMVSAYGAWLRQMEADSINVKIIDDLRGKFSELEKSISESLATTDAEKFARRVKESADEVEVLANKFSKVDEAGFVKVAMEILKLKGETISATEAVRLLGEAMTDGMNQMHPSIQSAIGMVDAMKNKLAEANATSDLEKLELAVNKGASAFRKLVDSIPDNNAGRDALNALKVSLGTATTDSGELAEAYSAMIRSMEEDSKTFKINVGEMLAGSMTQVFTGIARGTREAKDILKGFQDFTINVFGQMFSEMLKSKLDFDAVWEKNWLEDIPGAVKSGMKSVGEFVLQTMQLVVNAIGAGLGLDWNFGGGLTAPAGTAARVDASAAAGGPTMELATGGITTGPRLAMVGDNPSGTEAIIPLERWKEVMGGAGGGGGTQVVIHAPTALMSQKRKQDSQGREMLEFIFEGAKGAVAQDIMQGGEVSQAMSAAFGAKRGGGR